MSAKHIKHIDGLRALAVLGVLAFHSAVHNTQIHASQTISSFLLRQGCHGVDLFFVLSGFCLAYPSLSRLNADGQARFDVASFAARRIVRIVPPYYAAIAVMLTFALVLGALHVRLPESMPLHGFSVSDVLQQALFLDANVRFLDASFWTLAVELRWYFLFPVLLWVWTKSPRAFFALAVGAFLMSNTNMRSIDFAVLPTFMLGIVAAHLHIRYAHAKRWALPAAIVLAATAALTTAAFPWNYVWSPFWGPAMFCFVVGAGDSALLVRILSWRPLAFIGTSSYGIYLVHEPVASFVSEHVLRTAGAGGFLVAAIAALIAGIGFSWLAERPFVSTPLRLRIVKHLEPIFAMLFARLSVVRMLALTGGSSAPVAERRKAQALEVAV